MRPASTRPASAARCSSGRVRATAEAFERVRSTYGQPGVVRMFFPGMPWSWSSIQNNIGDTRALVSFKAPLNEIVAGQHDAFFRNWFANAPTGPRHALVVVARAGGRPRARPAQPGHLPARVEPPREPGAPGQQRAAAVHPDPDVLDPRAELRPAVAGLLRRPRRRSTCSGFDCYNGGHVNAAYRAPADMLADVVRVSNATGKPWGIAELGSIIVRGDDGSGRAQWLRGVANFAREQRWPLRQLLRQRRRHRLPPARRPVAQRVEVTWSAISGSGLGVGALSTALRRRADRPG